MLTIILTLALLTDFDIETHRAKVSKCRLMFMPVIKSFGSATLTLKIDFMGFGEQLNEMLLFR
jgi:hypothetical protein